MVCLRPSCRSWSRFFFFQAEDGIRDGRVTGVQTCALPIYNNVVYFCSYDGYCYAADATTGKEKWKFKIGGEKKVGAKGLWTMKPADMYMEDQYDFFLSSPAVEMIDKDLTVFFGSSEGNLYAVNAETGALKWKFKT